MPNTANTDFKRILLRHNRRRWLSRTIGSWPFLVWLALVALCAVLYLGNAQYGLLPGNCIPTHHEVAPFLIMLGGFLARKGDGEPGVKTLWLGMQRLRDFVAGVEHMQAITNAG